MSSSNLGKILNISIVFMALFHSVYSMDLDNSSSNRTASTVSLESQKEDISDTRKMHDIYSEKYNQIHDEFYNEKINLPKRSNSAHKVKRYINKQQLLNNINRIARIRMLSNIIYGKKNDEIIFLGKPGVLQITNKKYSNIFVKQGSFQYMECLKAYLQSFKCKWKDFK